MARTKRYPGTIEKRGNSYGVILHIKGKKKARASAEDFASRKHAELTTQMDRRFSAGVWGGSGRSGIVG